MKNSVYSGSFPVVTLVEGNFLTVMNYASLRGAVLAFQPLLNGCQFAKRW
jgi:hypothetical protein